MLKGAVAGRYAEALYEIAVRENIVDTLENELKAIVAAIEASPELKKVLYHPRITAGDKKEVVKRLFAENLSQVTVNFLSMVIDRQRETFLGDMVAVFVELANKARNITDIHVTSAAELTAGQKQMMSDNLCKVTGRKVQITYSVDPSLMGGVIARVGDKVIDGSIKTRLASLREHLRQIS
jgi:F-type H+-transporting ATPase subunit delta